MREGKITKESVSDTRTNERDLSGEKRDSPRYRDNWPRYTEKGRLFSGAAGKTFCGFYTLQSGKKGGKMQSIYPCGDSAPTKQEEEKT